jgi:FixJ family two-component response regulator
MAPVVTAGKSPTKTTKPCVLVVDDEPEVLKLFTDIVGKQSRCTILRAPDIKQAKLLMDKHPVHLLVADISLPDGDGMELIPRLQEKHPSASAIIITGRPDVHSTINALRAGAVDFLPKPFTADAVVERVTNALARQSLSARTEKRLGRLRSAVRKLNASRKLVTKKVDLLCNDLIGAYGDLAKQMDSVRHQEAFRKLMREARDLEQMLCHAMDWMLREAGYANVAIWLAADADQYQLGAYMKYTIAGDQSLTDSMQKGIINRIIRENFLHVKSDQLEAMLTPSEFNHLQGQTMLATTCTYLGEALAVVVMFRDDKSPFTDEDAAMPATPGRTLAKADSPTTMKRARTMPTGGSAAKPRRFSKPESRMLE